ncbi:MAG TPA: hypothetical protein V6C76_14865 [Drouetiella sp.]
MFSGLFNKVLEIVGQGRARGKQGDIGQYQLPEMKITSIQNLTRKGSISRQFAGVGQANIKRAQSSWVHGRYQPSVAPSLQQRINLMYAPVAHSVSAADSFLSANANTTVGEQSHMVNDRPMLLDPHARQIRKVLAKIVTHPDDDVRTYIAENENTPEPGLRVLAFDASDRVRLALIKNPNCPEDIQRLLIGDQNSVVSFKAVERVKQSWTKRSA